MITTEEIKEMRERCRVSDLYDYVPFQFLKDLPRALDDIEEKNKQIALLINRLDKLAIELNNIRSPKGGRAQKFNYNPPPTT